MHLHKIFGLFAIAGLAAAGAMAQTTGKNADDAEQLRITALEALASAEPDKALPIAAKVLQGDYSAALKKRALFILSQAETPQAQRMLLDTARSGDASLRAEAIRMIGIGGEPDALAGLRDIYAVGDADTREAVLEAYLIADDAEAVYQVAVAAKSGEEFEQAVNILGAMEARDQLRRLRDELGSSEELIDAYSVAGDFDGLRELAMDNAKPEQQVQAIRGLGVVGGAKANAALLEIYRATNSAQIKEAALEGMLISEYDDGVLQLFRESQDNAEKQLLLRTLVNMDSDAMMEVIESTFDGGR